MTLSAHLPSRFLVPLLSILWGSTKLNESWIFCLWWLLTVVYLTGRYIMEIKSNFANSVSIYVSRCYHHLIIQLKSLLCCYRDCRLLVRLKKTAVGKVKSRRSLTTLVYRSFSRKWINNFLLLLVLSLAQCWTYDFSNWSSVASFIYYGSSKRCSERRERKEEN